MSTSKMNNFCDGSPITIDGHDHEEFGALVSIMQSRGSMSFQHSMRPAQVRELAALLLVAADEAEAAEAARKRQISQYEAIGMDEKS